jgi:hypothetical protein
LDHLLLARVALSCLCGIQAIATVAIDFNRTHATNPLWTGHARFHLVWQSATIVFLSPLGFLTAYVSRRRYAGTLSDPNGIPSARVRLFGDVRAIDMNLAAVIVAILALIAILAIYRA